MIRTGIPRKAIKGFSARKEGAHKKDKTQDLVGG
jgi:hypothetical protein